MNTITRMCYSGIFVLTLVLLMFTCKEQPKGYEIVKGNDYIRRAVAKSGLNVREKPDANSRILGVLPFGTTFWVRNEFTQPIAIDGRSGKWLYIETYFDHDAKGKPRPSINGWAFSGYMGDSFFQLKHSFKDFKAGCLGGGCNVCGAHVFDPDGLYIRSTYCEGSSPDVGRWQEVGGKLIACIGSGCKPSASDPNALIYFLGANNMISIPEKGKIIEIENRVSYWEPDGWAYITERNPNLVPPE